MFDSKVSRPKISHQKQFGKERRENNLTKMFWQDAAKVWVHLLLTKLLME